MAKTPLARPEAPPGPQFQFFDLLQQTVRRHGDLSLDAIVKKGFYASRAVLHRWLIGPKLPPRRMLDELAGVLGFSEEEREALIDAFSAAQEDHIHRQRYGVQEQLPAPPAGRSARSVFQQSLRDLMLAAGSPPYRVIERRAMHRDPPFSMSTSRLSDWLNGKSLPASREDLVALVAVLNREAQRLNFSGHLASWQEWDRLWQAARSERRV
ncbi:hypothetical protein [Nonomuraea typhae]|uniref:XRE family transcriptional regulator n=1 Tax=Nonomuraea typhae TaxID=2603600 RepID=A0ABW7YYN9_9ACTN